MESHISSQQLILETALRAQGWRIVCRTTEDLEWWADEIWNIESDWRPCGLQVFVTFVVDGLGYSHNRRRGEGVWAVECTAKIPASSSASKEIAFESLNNWTDKVTKIVTTLAQFRNNVAVSK